MTDILVLENLSISAGDKSILRQANLAIEDCKLSVFMGPMGSGKSTLIKFLAGVGDLQNLSITYDKALYAGQELGKPDWPVVIFQKQRKQGKREVRPAARLNEINAAFKAARGLLCIDEPTAGLSKKDGAKIMRRLREIAKTQAVLVISHKIDEVKNFADHVALIAGGRIVTTQPADQFFDGKTDPAATHFLKTGGLDIPYENTPVHFLSPDQRSTPSGFNHDIADLAPGKENWILEGQFSLMSLPVDTRGNLEKAALSTLKTSGYVLHFHLSELTVYNASAEVDTVFNWDSTHGQLDQNPVQSAKIFRHIAQLMAAGHCVTLNTAFNQNAGATILGAFLISKHFSPADALDLIGKKFPDLHLGMRLEQFLWDVEIELAI